jgi:G3E family GTPase
MAEVTPITLLIGLAGAGKTTLLTRLLGQPEAAGVAVVTAQHDRPMWLNAGCACCAPRDDVARALRSMLPRVRRDEVRRVVIEAVGQADPGPILATLLSDTVAASAYRLDAIVTVVDAVNGIAALDRSESAVRQVAMADRIVLSKTDLADPSELRAPDLCARLRRINPGAPVVAVRHGVADPSVVLRATLVDAAGTAPDLRAWLNVEAFLATDHRAPLHDPAGDDPHIEAFCLVFDRPLVWRNVARWLEHLILIHGGSLLRMKGILHLDGQDRPVAIHSAGHLLHPPVTLAAWPDGDPRHSRLAFITRDLPRATVEAAAPMPADVVAEVE